MNPQPADTITPVNAFSAGYIGPAAAPADFFLPEAQIGIETVSGVHAALRNFNRLTKGQFPQELGTPERTFFDLQEASIRTALNNLAIEKVTTDGEVTPAPLDHFQRKALEGLLDVAKLRVLTIEELESYTIRSLAEMSVEIGTVNHFLYAESYGTRNLMSLQDSVFNIEQTLKKIHMSPELQTMVSAHEIETLERWAQTGKLLFARLSQNLNERYSVKRNRYPVLSAGDMDLERIEELTGNHTHADPDASVTKRRAMRHIIERRRQVRIHNPPENDSAYEVHSRDRNRPITHGIARAVRHIRHRGSANARNTNSRKMLI